MKIAFGFVIVFLFSVNLFAMSLDKTNVLFIGNSITYFNDMPETFESIANSLGDSTEITMYAPGGTGFANHVNDANVYSLLRQGNWDFIVLQPGTGDSGGESVGGTPIETTLSRIRIILDSAYSYSPCAQVLFYEISNGVTGDTPENIEHYNNIMDLIRSNLEFFSDSTHLPFAPVGEAFRTSWNNDQTLLLWNSYNDIHPNPKGSYLAACTFYASIFQKPSFGSSELSGLGLSEAEYFQQLADSVVLNHFSLWNINEFLHENSFEFEGEGSEFQFTSHALNYDSLMWDFGDGTFSVLENPVHTYSEAGDYTVSLTSWRNGCQLTSNQSVGLTGSCLYNFESETVIYPNPVRNVLNIQNNDLTDVRYSVVSLAGIVKMRGVGKIINVSDLSPGIYFLILEYENDCISMKFTKE